MSLRVFAHAALASVSVFTAAVPAFAAPVFAPHRAVYDVKLERAEERSGISGMEGRLVFEFSGSKCDGYAMNMRFVLRIQLPDDVRVTDQQTTTFESGDGREFTFLTKTFTDDKLDKELRGSAALSGTGIAVTLEKPAELDVTLEPSQFPTAHLAELIAKAQSGVRFYETTLFDGSDDADRLLTTAVVIGPEKAESEGPTLEPAIAEGLKGSRHWPVTISYFDPLEETGGEALPQYTIAFNLHENGITRDLSMDYGDFALSGALTKLEILPEPAACPAE
jgi:hypothetical protein